MNREANLLIFESQKQSSRKVEIGNNSNNEKKFFKKSKSIPQQNSSSRSEGRFFFHEISFPVFFVTNNE